MSKKKKHRTIVDFDQCELFPNPYALTNFLCFCDDMARMNPEQRAEAIKCVSKFGERWLEAIRYALDMVAADEEAGRAKNP